MYNCLLNQIVPDTMKKLFTLVLTILTSVSLALAIHVYTSWKIMEDDYVIRFKTDKANGTMKGLEGQILFDEQNLDKSNIKVSVDVNTIATGIWLKNNHAKAKSFFDSESYPKIYFSSTHFQKSGSGYIVEGDLKIKDTTKRIQIPFSFHSNQNKGEFSGSFQINRTDYGLLKNGVGELVNIDIKLPVSQ